MHSVASRMNVSPFTDAVYLLTGSDEAIQKVRDGNGRSHGVEEDRTFMRYGAFKERKINAVPSISILYPRFYFELNKTFHMSLRNYLRSFVIKYNIKNKTVQYKKRFHL